MFRRYGSALLLLNLIFTLSVHLNEATAANQGTQKNIGETVALNLALVNFNKANSMKP